MWKLPFNVLGAEAYSDQIFDNVEECLEKCQPALVHARAQLARKRVTVERFLIFRNQVVALPPSYLDQRLLGVGDMPGCEFEENRPTSISFEA